MVCPVVTETSDLFDFNRAGQWCRFATVTLSNQGEIEALSAYHRVIVFCDLWQLYL